MSPLSHSPSLSADDASANRNAAWRAFADFQRSEQAGVWPYLDKWQLLSEVRSRLENPLRVNQGQQPFCGPASILFELIRKRPLRYIEIFRSLFEQGSFQGATQRIYASEALRQASRGDLQMGQADWMLLATLRESENLIFPVEPRAPEVVRNIAGMTKSWEMKGWVREILGYPQVHYHHAYLFRDLHAMRRAERAIALGGVAFALVTAEGMFSQDKVQTIEESRRAQAIAYPNHWITLLGEIHLNPSPFWQPNKGSVSFDVYTWARKMHVEIGHYPFKRFFWGVVTGEP